MCVPRPLLHDSCTLNSPLVRYIYWHFYISRTIYRCLLSWSAIICICFVFCHFRFDFWVLGTSVCAICQARWVQNVLSLRVGTAWTPLPSLSLLLSLSLHQLWHASWNFIDWNTLLEFFVPAALPLLKLSISSNRMSSSIRRRTKTAHFEMCLNWGHNTILWTVRINWHCKPLEIPAKWFGIVVFISMTFPG